jgi:hypothetical protein
MCAANVKREVVGRKKSDFRHRLHVKALPVAMRRNPGESPREVGTSRRSIQRTLYSNLKLSPHIISVLHSLSEHENERRLLLADWAEEENATIHYTRTWFSDEAYIYLD